MNTNMNKFLPNDSHPIDTYCLTILRYNSIYFFIRIKSNE